MNARAVMDLHYCKKSNITSGVNSLLRDLRTVTQLLYDRENSELARVHLQVKY